MLNKSYLRPTSVGELRGDDMVAIEGRQLVAWGIQMPANAHLWALCHFEITRVLHRYVGDTLTITLQMRTQSSLIVSSERHRGWLELNVHDIDPAVEVEMLRPSPRRRRRNIVRSASAETLTTA